MTHLLDTLACTLAAVTGAGGLPASLLVVEHMTHCANMMAMLVLHVQLVQRSSRMLPAALP